MPKLLCPHCLQPLDNGYHGECVHCGRSLENRNPEGALPLGTQLGGKYTVGAYLSADGDGLSYRGVLNAEKRFVLIKEYFPVTLCNGRSASGALMPKEEKEVLFKTSRMDFKDLYDDLHNLTPATGLSTILDVMEENNTVYAVEESEKGMTLSHYLHLRSRTLTPAEARTLLEKTNIVNIPFSDQLPLAQLHWLIADKTGSIVVESTADGLHIYDNPVGVLTNNPPFPQQLFTLNNYRALSPRTPAATFADGLDLPVYSRGLGALGLPGDLSSQSRFVRAAFVKMNSKSGDSETESVGQFFHILHAVEQQRGCCELDGGKYEITLYTSCCNADRGIYYYTTYGNHQITAVDMHRENLDGTRLVRYPLGQGEKIAFQN